MRLHWPEWLFVLGLGLSLSVILNHHSSKGLDVSRNYFPDQPGPSGPSSPLGNPAGGQIPTFEEEVARAVERLQGKGFQAFDTEEMAALMDDPGLEAGLVVIIDARNEALYQEGHIPTAFLFDHYQMEQYVDWVLPMCQIADQIVVYCSGGHCEDSEFTANDLMQLGVPQEKLYIYAAGMRGWNEAGYPLALGDRIDDLDEWRSHASLQEETQP